jgi:hypothetical protein
VDAPDKKENLVLTQKLMVSRSYKAAPTTDRETARPIPIADHMWGDVSSKNLKKYLLTVMR